MAGTIQADSITNSAGTGAPNFPFGLTTSLVKSQVSLYGGTAFGSSSGNLTLVFDNIVKNTGTDITYNHDTINGDTFTINTTGIYAVSGNIGNQSSGLSGYTKNNAPNVSAANASSANLIASTVVGANAQGSALSYVGVLTAGDVIRLQYSNSTDTINSSPYLNIFNIVKLSS